MGLTKEQLARLLAMSDDEKLAVLRDINRKLGIKPLKLDSQTPTELATLKPEPEEPK